MRGVECGVMSAEGIKWDADFRRKCRIEAGKMQNEIKSILYIFFFFLF
jgi:hypothetical protein